MRQPRRNLGKAKPDLLRKQSEWASRRKSIRIRAGLNAPCRSLALESGANPRPEKRLHRTVLRALPLSKQERKNAAFRGGRRQKTVHVPALNRFQKRSLCQPRRNPGKAKPGSLRKQGRMSWPPKASQASDFGIRGSGWIRAGFGLGQAEPSLPCRLSAPKSGANSRLKKLLHRTV